MSVELLSFYAFHRIEEPEKSAKAYYSAAKELELTGTIVMAPEGINIALCGTRKNLDLFLYQKLEAACQPHAAVLRRFQLQNPVYKNLVLKRKAEIVSSRFGFACTGDRAGHLSPDEFYNMAMQNAEASLLLDLRNTYETSIGSFKGALHLKLQEFHELPQRIDALSPYKKHKLLTFCTGGVRCEKALPLLKAAGFEAYQLHGGILGYLESCRPQAIQGHDGLGNQQSAGEREEMKRKRRELWQDECFVFDNRVSLTKELEQGSYEWCKRCGQASRNGICTMCGK